MVAWYWLIVVTIIAGSFGAIIMGILAGGKDGEGD